MSGKRSKRSEALALLLKTSFARHRSPWQLVIPVCAVLLVIGLAAFWLWPTSVPRHVLMAAMDAIALPDQLFPLRAMLEAAKPEQRDQPLTGCELYFQAANSNNLLGTSKTGADGVAILQSQFPVSSEPVPVVVRYPGIKDRQRGAQADCRIFVWPQDSSILIVADTAPLAGNLRDEFWRETNFGLKPAEGAATALRAATSGRRIAYFSRDCDSAERYNKMRSWLAQARTSQNDRFPPGPLLSPLCGEESESLERLLETLVSRFQGKHIGIALDEADAAAFARAGFDVFLVGTASANENVRRVPDWKALVKALEKSSQ